MSVEICTHRVLIKIPKLQLSPYHYKHPELIYKCEECRTWLCVNLTVIETPLPERTRANHA
jgi:hypothetical protein